MTPVEPANLDEYNDRAKHHYRLEGFGFAAVTIHWPCPMCAAADWYIGRLFDLNGGIDDTLCNACGRTSRMQVEHTLDVTTSRIVFVAGPPPPQWMQDMKPRIYHEGEPLA